MIFDKPFLSGEDNMSHTIANLEAHHFKYAGLPPPRRCACAFLRHRHPVLQRRGARPRTGDVFEIEADAFLFPLRNALGAAPVADAKVRAL